MRLMVLAVNESFPDHCARGGSRYSVIAKIA